MLGKRNKKANGETVPVGMTIRFRDRGALLAGALMVVAWSIHAHFVWKYAVDFPVSDEVWALAAASPHHSSSTLVWIFTKHGDHPIVFTKVLYALLLYTGNLNFAFLICTNFVLFGAVLVAFIVAARTAFASVPLWLIMLATAFLLSGRAWENHGWSFQNQFHFMLLFSFLAVHFLFTRRSISSALIGAFFAECASLSFGAGTPFMVAVGLALLAKHALAVRADAADRRSLGLLVITVLWITAIVSIHITMLRPVPGQIITLPTDKLFWRFLLGMVSSGFGADFDSASANRVLARRGIVGGFFLAVVLLPIAIQIRRAYRAADWRSINFAGIALTLGILGALASISVGRAAWWGTPAAGFGEKQSRYTEFSMFLIPITIAWYWSFFRRKEIRVATMSAMFAALLLLFAMNRDGRGFYNNWDLDRLYGTWMLPRRAGFVCLGSYFTTGQLPNCARQYLNCPEEICRDFLDFARDRKLPMVAKAIRAQRLPAP